MRQIKRILVATDFSDSAAEAIRLAVDMAQRFGASLTLLHVYQMVVYPLPEAGAFSGMLSQPDTIGPARDALELVRSRTASIVPTTVEICEGTPHAEIVRTARDGNFDLIVIGTTGRTGLKHMLLGSVAEKVVRGAPCPVLSVRLPTDEEAHKHETEKASTEGPTPAV